MKREDLINTKVYVDGRSAEIQEKLFELGYSWFPGDVKIQYTDAPFLFMEVDGDELTIKYLNNMEDFEKYTHREIKVEDILNIEVPKFKPFQKVLVRDSDNQEWRPQFFSYFRGEDSEYPYLCMGDSYKEMIPYEGNEHLLYTTNDPDIDR